VQVSRDGVLWIQLKRPIERGRRVVQLPELEAAPREARPGSLVGRRQRRELFVDRSRVGTEIPTLRKIDGLLLERREVIHAS
jgi:hypothetical protein